MRHGVLLVHLLVVDVDSIETIGAHISEEVVGSILRMVRKVTVAVGGAIDPREDGHLHAVMMGGLDEIARRIAGRLAQCSVGGNDDRSETEVGQAVPTDSLRLPTAKTGR